MSVNHKYNKIEQYTGWYGGTGEVVPVDAAEIKRIFKDTDAWLNTLEANLNSNAIWTKGAKASAYYINGTATGEEAYPTFLSGGYLYGEVSTRRWGLSVDEYRIDNTRKNSRKCIHAIRDALAQARVSFAKNEHFVVGTLDSVLSGGSKLIGSIYAVGYWHVEDATRCSECNLIFFTEHDRDFHHIIRSCDAGEAFAQTLGHNEKAYIYLSQLVNKYSINHEERRFILENVKLKWDESGIAYVPLWLDTMLAQREDLNIDMPFGEIYELYRSQAGIDS